MNNDDQKDVGPLDRLAYLMGLVTAPERRTAIEATMPDFGQFMEASDVAATDELFGLDGSENILELLESYFAERSKTRRVINAVRQELQANPGDRTLTTVEPLLKDWDAERHGGWFVPSRGASPAVFASAGLRKAELPEPPYVVWDEHCIAIAQPQKSIPYGVVRIIASSEGGPLASMVWIMPFDENTKLWEETIPTTALFGQNLPRVSFDIYVQPALPETFPWFFPDELKAQEERLAPHKRSDTQRAALHALLRELTEVHNDDGH